MELNAEHFGCHCALIIYDRVVDSRAVCLCGCYNVDVKLKRIIPRRIGMVCGDIHCIGSDLLQIFKSCREEILHRIGIDVAVEVTANDHRAVVLIRDLLDKIRKLCGILDTRRLAEIIACPIEMGRTDGENVTAIFILEHSPGNRLRLIARAVIIKVISTLNDIKLIRKVKQSRVILLVAVGGSNRNGGLSELLHSGMIIRNARRIFLQTDNVGKIFIMKLCLHLVS